jgi:hypothetical protein
MKKQLTLIFIFSAFIANAQRTMFTGQNNYVAPPSPPVLVTTAVTAITGTTATSGGTITSDGGATVTSRGLVWGTSPGASTFSTTSGAGSGTFSTNLTGLNISTTYYVRAFATNSVATVYGAEISFTTITPPPPAVGDNYGGGKIFYIFQPGDPGYVAGQYHGLIAAPSDIPSNAYRIFIGCYGNVGTSAALGTGAANTTTLISSCNDTYNAAKLVDALTDGGYSDWYLPSKDELNKLYLNKNSVGNFADGSYWSSTECLGWVGGVYYGDFWQEAYYQWFHDAADTWFYGVAPGTQSFGGKNYQKGIRAIRTF